MLVLVEGPDGTGKTTLVNKLCNVYGYRKVEPPTAKESQADFLEEWENLDELGKTFILDRSFISEFVYRLFDENYCCISLDDTFRLLSDDGCKVIYCNADNGFELATARGEDNITNKKDWLTIKSIYDVLFKIAKTHLSTDIMEYDLQTTPTVDVIRFINKG